MGVILNGILGGFSGKVGPVVGGKWKDVDYMRSYVKPANPNTENQQAVRGKFSQLVATARLLLSSILQPFWDPFISNMSGFNKFISVNYPLSTSEGILQASSLVSQGTLETLHTNTSTYNTGTGFVDTTFDDTIQGNGLATDVVVHVIYNISTGQVWIETNSSDRTTGEASTQIPTGLTATNLIAYVFAFRGTGSELVVSDSIGDVCAAP